MTPIGDIAQGRWRSILPALGVSTDYLSGKHGPCPICKDGKDRFRFDDKGQKGTWFCGHCGAGDGVKLLMLVNGWDFKEAVAEISRIAGVSPVESAKAERSAEDRSRAMNAIWGQGKAIQADSAAFRYLHGRTGLSAFCGDLRAITGMAHCAPAKTTHPGLLALVRDRAGKAVNIHRTYLTAAGAKAALDDSKKLMEGAVPPGSAVRLFPPAEIMGVAEGIETALSVQALFGVPTWATLSDNRLATWAPPAGCRSVIVFGDRDRSFAGQAAAYALAKRLRTEKFDVEVRLPEVVGMDWNDVWTETMIDQMRVSA